MAKRPSGKLSNTLRLSLFWAILVLSTLAVWAFVSPHGTLKEVAISDVISRANKGEVAKLTIQGDEVKVTPKGQTEPTEHATKEDSSIYDQGLEKGKTQIEV